MHKEQKSMMPLNRKQKYRKNHKTVSLSFSFDKAKALHEVATRHGKTPPQFLKCLLDASLHGTGYVLPNDNKLQELLLALRHIGNNINQLTRHVHEKGVITHSDIKYLQQRLMQLEKHVTIALERPPSISDILTEHLDEHPETLQSLRAWINQYDHDNKSPFR